MAHSLLRLAAKEKEPGVWGAKAYRDAAWQDGTKVLNRITASTNDEYPSKEAALTKLRSQLDTIVGKRGGTIFYSGCSATTTGVDWDRGQA